MLKKIISMLLVSTMIFSQISIASGSSYESKIQAVVENMTLEKLQSIDAKIDKIYASGVKLSEKNSMILNYLAAAIDARLLDGTAFSKNEVATVNAEIMQIQNNMAAGMSGQFDALIGELLKLYNVEEKGDLSMNFELDFEGTSANGELKLDNYTAIVSGFDSQIKTDISAFMSVDVDEKNMMFDMSAFLDYISKDGNIYVLLDDLNIDTNRLEDVEDIVETLQNIAAENGYISVQDDASAQAIQLLESFAPNVILDDMMEIFEQPLLRLHSKRGDKYILVPTKYACDQGKILSGKFDPFYKSDECSDAQYNELVREFTGPDAYLYMTLGRNTTLGISATEGDMVMKGDIVFNDTHILSSNLDISEDENSMNFEYKLKSHVSLVANIPDEDLDFNMYTKLNYNNYITSGNMDMTARSGDDEFTMSMDIKSGNISGKAHMIDGGEDMFEMNLSGTYGRDTLSMDIDFEIFENPFESRWDIQYVDEMIEGEECYENYYGDEAYVCYVEKQPSGDTISGEFSFESDTKYSKNNLDMFLRILLADDQIFKFEMKNRSRQQFKDTQIDTPTNTTPIEDILPKYDYVDDYYYEEEAQDAAEEVVE